MRRHIIQRFGAARNDYAPDEAQKRGNEFFEWLETLNPQRSGSQCLMPAGHQASFLGHDVFGGCDEFIKHGGAYYMLPNADTRFQGMTYWLIDKGRRVFVAFHYGMSAAIFEVTVLQLVNQRANLTTQQRPILTRDLC